MIAATAFVAVIGAVLALIWTMQRRLMYFPTGGVPTPGEIGLTGVEAVISSCFPTPITTITSCSREAK